MKTARRFRQPTLCPALSTRLAEVLVFTRQSSRIIWRWTFRALLLTVAVTAWLPPVHAQVGSVTVLHSFSGFPEGRSPTGLVQGSDGNLYGTTLYGGTYNFGVIYRLTPAGMKTVLYNFTGGTDGAATFTQLVQSSDGNLYGTTGGTVFRVSPTGALTTLHRFVDTYANGLVLAKDGNFYGTTKVGPTTSTFFRLTPTGVLTTLRQFVTSTDGQPVSNFNLIQGSDGNFYGVAEGSIDSSHPNGRGTVFQITPTGVLTTLYSGFANNDLPSSLLQGQDGNFYGTTPGLGTDSTSGDPEGSVFRITPAGVLTTLHSFSFLVDGTEPGGLAQGSDGNIYGTTYDTIFRITPTGTLTTLYKFKGGSDGGGGGGSAVLSLASDGNFYGTTTIGGNGNGTVFRVTPAGVLTTLYSFAGNSDGANPLAALIQGSDGNFYGSTSVGGPHGSGTAFQLAPTGTLTVLHGFAALDGSTTNSDGTQPSALVQGRDGIFYGAALQGGVNGYGTIFHVASDGAFTILHTFQLSDGTEPLGTLSFGELVSQSALVQGNDGNFYGTTSSGGSNLKGTVFRITPTGALTTLHSFNGSDGDFPQAGLLQGVDGNFYGTTADGGANGSGTAFRMTLDGVLNTIHDFGAPGDNIAGKPHTALTQGNDGNLYGTDTSTVFRLTLNGALTVIHSFDYFKEGGSPNTLIFGRDGNLYGTNSNGGTNGQGTAFRMTTTGALTTLYSFTGGGDGGLPAAALLQGNDGNFYGATYNGGAYKNGVIFRLSTTLSGALQFDHSDYTLDEYAGSATLSVNRVSGSQGTVSVAYSTVDGTAKAGRDYQSTNGLLTWVDSDTAAKTIVVPILDRGITYNPDDFSPTLSVALSGVTGGAAFGSPATATLYIVDDDPTVPRPTCASYASAQVGVAFIYQITATTLPTSFGASGLPAGLQVNSSTGLISGTPTQSGQFFPLISASNANGSGGFNLVLVVSPASVNAPAITSPATTSAQVGTPFSYQIAATNAPTSYGASGLPPGLGVNPTGLISGTPTQTGTYTVGLSAANAGGTGTAALTVTVSATPVPAPVLGGAATASGQVGAAFSYQIAATNSPTRFNAAGLPLGLAVSTATGLISGTPTAAGTFPVTLTAANTTGTGTATLSLTIAAPALPTVSLAATTPQVTEGSGGAGVFTVSLSAPQPNDLIVRYTIKGTAINGTDYALLTGTKKIKAGKTSKPIKIIPQGNLGGATSKAVKLILAPGDGYTVGTTGKVKVKILGQ